MRGIERLAPYITSALALIPLAAIIALTSLITYHGLGALSWRFISSSILRGGVYEAVVGTLLLFSGATAIAAPLGVLAAVYLVEYAPRSWLTELVERAVENLAGVPSILYGLFGFTLFSKLLGFGISLLSGWLTLACMMLPIIVRSSQEALRMVPRSIREASLALGASKWTTITRCILPAAAPGIATGVILGVCRVAGETAAILLTSCFYTMRGLPRSPLDPVLSLTYYLYILIVAKAGDTPLEVIFAISLLLFLLVVALNSTALILRFRYRGVKRW